MNKNTQKESRERVLIVLCEKNIDWIIEMISNFIQNKIRRRGVKI